MSLNPAQMRSIINNSIISFLFEEWKNERGSPPFEECEIIFRRRIAAVSADTRRVDILINIPKQRIHEYTHHA